MNYPKKVDLPDVFREMILDGGKTYEKFACYDTLHRGMSCNQYLIFKIKRQSKHAAKICIFFSLIPNLIANARKLNDLETWKTIAKKFIKAVLFYGLAACLPGIVSCWFSPHLKSIG